MDLYSQLKQEEMRRQQEKENPWRKNQATDDLNDLNLCS